MILREAEEYYYNLLNTKKTLNRNIKYAKKALHHLYVLENRKELIVTDICVILIVIFNMSALGITNALVVRDHVQHNKTIELLENNPIQSKINGFKPHSDAKSTIMIFVIQSMIWTLIISVYIWRRITIIDDLEYMHLVIVVLFYLVITGNDFVNDFGYWIGKIIWR